MNFSRQVSRMLDDEHRTHLALLGQVEQALGRAARPDPALTPLLGRFAQAIEHDLERHFDFEETALFPRMTASGDGGMVAVLKEEHDTIRDVARELLPLTRSAEAGAADADDWATLRRHALELIERQVSHIQKETMALLPLLDDLLDDDTDRDLAFAYAAL